MSAPKWDGLILARNGALANKLVIPLLLGSGCIGGSFVIFLEFKNKPDN